MKRNTTSNLLMRYITIYILLTVLCIHPVRGQLKELKLQDAVSIGMKNNFSILISENSRDIAKNNNTLGNAGFLPAIGGNGTMRDNFISGNVQSATGEISKTDNAHSNTVNLNLTFDWTIFDGFSMFIQKNKLEGLQKLGESSLRATIENVLSQIIVSYYFIVQSKNRLKMLQDAIDFSNRRKDLTMKKYQLGLSSELAYLQSITDLNADSTAFLMQQAALKNAKADLNFLLVTDPAFDYNVDDTIQFKQVLDYNELTSLLQTSNSQINISKQNYEIAQMNYRLTHAPKYPQLNFFTDYSYSRTKYDYGQTRLNKSQGPVFGLGFTYSLFDGFNLRRNSANARIQTETSEIQLKQVTKQMETLIYQLYNDYQNNLKLVKFEAENLKITQQNTYIAFEKYRLGELSDIDLRQIQLKQLEADNNLLLSQFQAKQLETELMRLSGQLVQEK